MKRLLFLLTCGLFVATSFPAVAPAGEHALLRRRSVSTPRRIARLPIRLVRSLRRCDGCDACGHCDSLPRLGWRSGGLPCGGTGTDCPAGVCLPQ